MKPRFNVNDRVRVRVAKDVIPEDEINCDVGIVKAVKLMFPGTMHERIIYEVRLDKDYHKNFPRIGILVTVGEGWNMAGPEMQSIESEQQPPP